MPIQSALSPRFILLFGIWLSYFVPIAVTWFLFQGDWSTSEALQILLFILGATIIGICVGVIAARRGRFLLNAVWLAPLWAYVGIAFLLFVQSLLLHGVRSTVGGLLLATPGILLYVVPAAGACAFAQAFLLDPLEVIRLALKPVGECDTRGEGKAARSRRLRTPCRPGRVARAWRIVSPESR